MKKKTTKKEKIGIDKFLEEISSEPISQVRLQEEYAKKLNETHKRGLPLVHMQQFASSIRNSNYKDTGTAINEFVDNSIQAGANKVYVFVDPKISSIYIIDNGTGMSPEVLRYCVMWGGTHRSNSRIGWGRFGFGHPSAAFFLTDQYETYSKTKKGKWNSIGISLKEIEEDVSINKLVDEETGIIRVPEVNLDTSLPNEVIEFLAKNKIQLNSGTITHIKSESGEDTPHLTSKYIGLKQFTNRLLMSLGTTYREKELMERGVELRVNDKKVQPIDPLFLSENSLFYNKRGLDPRDTEYHEPLDSKEKLFKQGILAKGFDKELPISMTNSNGEIGFLRIRYALFHPFFPNELDNKTGLLKDTSPSLRYSLNRWAIMKENSGYAIITRQGRQIDVVRRSAYPKKIDNIDQGAISRPYARYWAFEIDFDPVLDEYFGVTIDKQQITLHDKVWEKLTELGVGTWIKNNLHIETDRLHEIERAKRKKRKILKKDKERKTLAEQVLQDYTSYRPEQVSETNQEEGDKYWNEMVKMILKKENKSGGLTTESEVRKSLKDKYTARPYRTKIEKFRGNGNIFDYVTLGRMGCEVTLNEAHPFIKNFYLHDETSDEMKLAIDILFHTYAVILSKTEHGRLAEMKRVLSLVAINSEEPLNQLFKKLK